MQLRPKTVTNGAMVQTLNRKVTNCGTVTSSNRTVALRAVARCSQPVAVSVAPAVPDSTTVHRADGYTNEDGASVE
jgi:hypothetical protein